MPSAQLARLQSRASPARRALAPRAGPRTLAASVLALQRSVGNAGVVHLLAATGAHRRLARQPRDPWEENQPPETGRQPGEEPGMTGCSVVRKNGGWYVKCASETYGPGPAIPTDPGSVHLPKPKPKTPLGPLTNPDQAPWLKRPPSLAEICERNPKAPICFDLGTKAPAPELPTGMFYIVDVRFEHNRPSGTQGGMTADGIGSLDSIVAHLTADPTLQVRLIGQASSEGTAAENLQLSERRARAVQAVLVAKGLGDRVMDFVGARDPSGCTRVEFGVWACGATRATAGEARPEDRKVAVTFLRNARFSGP